MVITITAMEKFGTMNISALTFAPSSASDSGMNMSGPSGPTRKSVGGIRPILRKE